MANQTRILASDVINQATKGHQPITDADLIANCEGCRAGVSLNSCRVTQGSETTYYCPGCNATLVVIGRTGTKPWPGRGYRMGDFSVRNAVDLTFGAVKMPKSPNALAPSTDEPI